MRIWPCLGSPCPPKLPRPEGGWLYYGTQDPVLPIPWVTGPWVQGLFGTYSTFTPIIAEQKCVYGPVWGDPVPPNCRVLRADGHFTVARTLYYQYHETTPMCTTNPSDWEFWGDQSWRLSPVHLDLMGSTTICWNISQGPGYRKMTIRLKDAAVCGDRVTPNRAIYAFLFCNYGCKSAICTKYPLDPGTVTHRMGSTGSWLP